jgi:hypothetical protein
MKLHEKKKNPICSDILGLHALLACALRLINRNSFLIFFHALNVWKISFPGFSDGKIFADFCLSNVVCAAIVRRMVALGYEKEIECKQLKKKKKKLKTKLNKFACMSVN